MISLAERLLQLAKTRAADEAILTYPTGFSLSYAQLWHQAGTYAATLPDRGPGVGYVMFRAREPWQLPIALLAAWRRGFALMPVAPDLKPAEELALIRQAGAPVAIWDGLPPPDPRPFPDDLLPLLDTLALLLPATGAEAAPRVFAFRHRELAEAAQVENSVWGEGGARRVLYLRTAHAPAGVHALWAPLARGDGLCFPRATFLRPQKETFEALLGAFRPSQVLASPPYLRALLLTYPENEECTARPEVVPVVYAGRRLKPREHRRLHARGLRTIMTYNMTECAHILAVREIGATEIDEEPSLVGKTLAPVLARAGDTFHFRAPGLAPFRLEAGATRSNLSEALWYTSDDRGQVTREGELCLEGRRKGEIIASGLRVSAAEVEAALAESGLVQEAVVTGVADGLLGQRVAALVVPKPGVTKTKLTEALSQSLSSYKIPTLWELREEIPVTGGGRRDWRAISACLQHSEKNLWAAHFELSIRLRKQPWRALPRLGALARAYRETLREKADPGRLEELYALTQELGGGKHVAYQRIWNWSALAFQEFKFQNDFTRAAVCLRKALELVPGMVTGRKYGHETPCVEAVWLFLLLNEARLDRRAGRAEAARSKLSALLRFLDEEPGALGAFDFNYDPEHYRFSRHPDLVSYLRGKVQEELEA